MFDGEWPTSMGASFVTEDGNHRTDVEADDILSRLKRRESGAPAKFVAMHSGMMHARALQLLKCSHAADDAVQEALCCAFRSLDRFEGRSSLKSWLYRIVTNAALMQLRKAKRRCESTFDGIEEIGDAALEADHQSWSQGATPPELLQRRQSCERVRAAVECLPANYRDIIQLRDLEERTTAETAELLSLSEANAKVRLHRARGALRKIIETAHPSGL